MHRKETTNTEGQTGLQTKEKPQTQFTILWNSIGLGDFRLDFSDPQGQSSPSSPLQCSNGGNRAQEMKPPKDAP